MKSKFVLRVLAAIGIIALSATVAQGGDGGKPSALTSFFVCHSINGASANKDVDVQSPVFGPNKFGVKIGNGTLACAIAKLFPAGDSADPLKAVTPNPSGIPGEFGDLDQLKCYTVSVSRKTSGNTFYNVTDALFAADLNSVLVGSFPIPGPDSLGPETVNPSEIRLICGPAKYFNR